MNAKSRQLTVLGTLLLMGTLATGLLVGRALALPNLGGKFASLRPQFRVLEADPALRLAESDQIHLTQVPVQAPADRLIEREVQTIHRINPMVWPPGVEVRAEFHRDRIQMPRDQQDEEIERLLSELRSVEADQRDKKKLAELRQALVKQFQARHDAQVARLEKVLSDAEKTQQILERRSKQRDEIIDRHLEDLLGQADVLDWDYPLPLNPRGEDVVTPQMSFRRAVGSGSIFPFLKTPGGDGAGQDSPGSQPLAAPAQTPTAPKPPTPPKAPPSTRSSREASAAQSARKLAEARFRAQEVQRGALERDVAPHAAVAAKIADQIAQAGGLQEQIASAQSQIESGKLRAAELAKLKDELAAAEAQWQSQAQVLELAKQTKELALEKARIELDQAAAELEEAIRRGDTSSDGAANVRKIQTWKRLAENALKRAQLELTSAELDLQRWAETSQRLKSPNSDASEKAKSPKQVDPAESLQAPTQ